MVATLGYIYVGGNASIEDCQRIDEGTAGRKEGREKRKRKLRGLERQTVASLQIIAFNCLCSHCRIVAVTSLLINAIKEVNEVTRKYRRTYRLTFKTQSYQHHYIGAHCTLRDALRTRRHWGRESAFCSTAI